MSIAIVYDSIFGNTAEVAKAIAATLQTHGPVQLIAVSDAKSLDLSAVELLIVGSPTRGFRPTPAISEFVEGLDGLQATGQRAAVFDTRIGLDTIHPAPLAWVVDAGGYAAERIARMLDHKGCVVVGPHAGFVVSGTEGPLKDGELDRARAWAGALVQKAAA